MAGKRPSKAEQIAQLEARLQKAKQELAAADRKADARRKILLGAAMFNAAKRDGKLYEQVLKIVEANVDDKDKDAVKQWLSTASPPVSSPEATADVAPPQPPTERANA